VVYDGLNKAKTKQEKEGTKGYAISFQGIMTVLMSLLPQSEVIQQALREKKTVYPEIALREIIANALIHQDFSISGAGPLIEIYDDRVEISNPGGLLPSKRLDRLIGTQPESRNEQLARAFRRYKICEERGSGLLKAGVEVELYGLPPIRFDAGPNHFKVTLFTPRPFAKMSPRERLDACYQHAVLKHFSGTAMTNTTLRERLKMPEKQRSMVSVLMQEALDHKLIKPADPENRSKKFAEYVPIWA
jgi:predicted HTH transcriptional regulator